jgi:hypothetical protein
VAESRHATRWTVTWDEAKRRAEEIRRAAGHHVRSDAERAAGQRRLDDEIRAWRLAEVRRNRSMTQLEVAEAMGGVRTECLRC